MFTNNKLIVAAAGSGKTTFLVKEALKIKDGKILISTYTEANEEEIRRKFIKINKYIPKNVTIQTWFSFLIKHGVKPYQGQMGLSDFECKGLLIVNSRSAKYAKEKDTKEHYFSNNQKIYSDKLSKFVVQCDKESKGLVIDRLSRIYTDIFIDEDQDLASYDLELLEILLQSKINVLLIGDPRQVTYLTHHAKRYKKYKDGKIELFIRNECKNYFNLNNIIGDYLLTNYRSCSKICELSNKLYPDLKKTTSGNTKSTGHDGVFIVNKKDLEIYLSKYKPMQLRWNDKVEVSSSYSVLTFGLSKGLEFERVLIYPTKPIIKWIKNNNSKLQPTSRSKFYVALTRARQSVGIVWDEDLQVEGINKFVSTKRGI